ncbi:hypothetical protein [Herbidospora cretacea]|uniref:hypothetical protein n=1 Tax=Herbidospora cretacea TaxID=28444 RepID=UPI0004C2DB9C|nr:hypothetical protein [Herbidospora cretacea]
MQLKKLASTLATAALVGGGAVLALATPAAADGGGYEWSGDDWGHGHHHGHHHHHNHTCVFKVRHGSHHADPKLHHGVFPAGRFRHYIRVHHRPHHHSRIVGYLHAGGYTIGKCHPVRGHHHHGGGWGGGDGGWDGGGDWGGDGGGWGHGFHGGHHFHKVKSHFKRHRWSPRTGFTEGWHLHKQYRWHRN